MNNSIGMSDFYHLTKEKNLRIIDVRETYEYQMGHVPYAKNLPLSSLGNQGYKVINVLGGTAAWPGELQG
jgi:rhodanese-related sulfurtransferase